MEFYHSITEEVRRRTKPSKACASAVLLSASLKFYYDYYNELQQPLKDQLKSLADLRQQHLRSLCSHFEQGIVLPRTRKILSVILECLDSDMDMIYTDSGFDESLCSSRPSKMNTTDFQSSLNCHSSKTTW